MGVSLFRAPKQRFLMQITYYGHSSCGIQADGKHLLFDPFITANEQAEAIDVDSIPADLLLLTHGHGDHVLDAERILKRTNAKLISNFEVGNWYAGKGIENYHQLNQGGTYADGDLRIKFVKAIHSSSMPDGSYGGNPGGFVVTSPQGNFYHAGDTALTLDMQLLKRYDLKFALLPIGDTFTMGVEDAVEAAQLIGCETIIGIHYNTFPPIVIDTVAAKASFKQAGIELLLPGIGETIKL